MPHIFEAAALGSVVLKNRLIRSATYEGSCTADGLPTPLYTEILETLARSNLGALITGFTYISQVGRAMQPCQAGIENRGQAAAFKAVTKRVHNHDCKIFMQIAHTGRQTLSRLTGQRVRGVSPGKSFYFGERPLPYTTAEVEQVIGQFARSACLAREAGFDGVQLHAAHGYLIHQFLLPAVNRRSDAFGVDPRTRVGTAFLGRVIGAVRKECGADFPLLVKISWGTDYVQRFTLRQYQALLAFLDTQALAGIEVSYGTMDYALSIFRGKSLPLDLILKENPVYRTNHPLLRFLWKTVFAPTLQMKIKPFSPGYNLEAAQLAGQLVKTPVIAVGGLRSGAEIAGALADGRIAFAGLCRPLICEPDFAVRLQANNAYRARCTDCNYCAVMCDSGRPTRCYRRNEL